MESNINIEEIKRDIQEQEEFTLKYVKEANNMFYLIIISVILFIYNLIVLNFIISSAFFVIGFLCLRRYNKTIGMIEIHTAIQKFLKMLLIKEQTGEDNFKNIIE
jgi:hypothetical protein